MLDIISSRSPLVWRIEVQLKNMRIGLKYDEIDDYDQNVFVFVLASILSFPSRSDESYEAGSLEDGRRQGRDRASVLQLVSLGGEARVCRRL